MATIISPVDALQLLVQEEVASTPLDMYPMLDRLRAAGNIRVARQRQIKWNVNAGGATATGEATSASISAFSADTYVPATLAIGENRIRHSFSIQKELIAEAASAGKGVLRDLFTADIRSGIRICLETLQTQIYTGTGLAANGGVVGLQEAVTAATYANINSATYTSWASFRSANAGTNRALTLALLTGMEVGIYNRGGNFTAIYTTPAIVATYKALFAAQANVQPAAIPSMTVDLGYTGVAYAGRPIIQDPYCPANRLFWVDERDIFLHTYGQSNSQAQEGFQFCFEQLPSDNPDALRYTVYIKPQLQVFNRPKDLAQLADIT
ncbi:phage major capsid protein [Nostoc sp. FACHB-87]|uniref:phage major capsid protein n=1 Tax=Nostocaceae TaxID=1162 RepID=UPI00168619F5|nr:MULTISPECIES: phage major capsid protein [Nostocaceae]MBD2457974.1 phage major capsid protein [Nostoc sp. FACHB-87]MBD2479249.1 phage major capsid protein [Anabaena sp. FACHB-83]